MAVAQVGSGVVGTDTVSTSSAAPVSASASVNLAGSGALTVPTVRLSNTAGIGLSGSGALSTNNSATVSNGSGGSANVAKVGSGVVGTDVVGTGNASYSVNVGLNASGALTVATKSASGSATGTASLTGSGALTSTFTSTNASNDPIAPIPNLVARYRADSVTGVASGSAVTTVSDISGNNYTLNQYVDSGGNALNGPAWVSNTVNGQPVFRFTGVETLQSNAPSGNSAQTIIAVMRSTGNNTLTIRGSDRPSGLQLRLEDNRLQLFKQSIQIVGASSTSVVNNTWHVVIATYDGNNNGSSFVVDGTALNTSNNALTGLDQNALTLLGRNGSENGENFNGDIAELFVYNRVLTAAEQTSIDNYAQKRYGIAVSDSSNYGSNVTLTSTGALTVTPNTVKATGAPALSGLGTLTFVGAKTSGASVNLSGTGSLSLNGAQTAALYPAFTGNGTLTTSVSSFVPGSAATSVALSSQGSLVISSNANAVKTLSLAGAGSLSAGGGQLSFANVRLNGNGALNTSVTIRFPASVALSGQGSLSAGLYLEQEYGSASLGGSGQLGAYGRGGMIGVPAPGVLQIKNNRNITGYSVEENATPINAASTEGGVGTISFGFPQRSNWLSLFEQSVELDDDFRGTTSGKISSLVAHAGILDITADNKLGTLVGEIQAYPLDGTFEAVARYYLKLGQITDGIYFDPDVKDIPVTAQGWHGDVWLNLKQLCTAYNVEVSLISNNVVFRPIRSITINPTKVIDLSETLDTADLARSVEITYYENIWADGDLVYPRTIDEMKAATVYQVDANGVVEDDIELSVSLQSIVQPVCVTDVQQGYDGTQSVYSVRAVDNSQVTPQQWAAGGGKIELTINDDTTSVHIKITGSNDQYHGPYRICGRVKEVSDITKIIVPPNDASQLDAIDPSTVDTNASKGSATTKPKKETAKEKADRLKKEAQEAAQKVAQAAYDANIAFADPSQSEQDYPTLYLIGTSAQVNKKVLSLPTGVPTFKTASDVGATVENIYVSALEDAYRVGTVVAAQYRGEQHTITATLGAINQRMGSGSIQYRTIADIDSQFKGMTIGQFRTQWAGKTIGDFNAAEKALVVDNFNNQVFGNVPGTRFRHGDAFFRITDATTTESNIEITAVRDTMLGDFADAHANQSIAVFNQLYAGKTLKEFGRAPLLGD